MTETITTSTSPPSELSTPTAPVNQDINTTTYTESLTVPSNNIESPDENLTIPSDNTKSVGENITEKAGFLSKVWGAMQYGWLLKGFFIVIVLAYLGYNVFLPMGKLTKDISQMIGPITSLMGDITRQTVDMSGEGAKDIVDSVVKPIDSGLDLIDSKANKKKQNSGKSKNSGKSNNSNEKGKKKKKGSSTDYPIPDDSGSVTQMSQSGKTGYCYIGEDRGFRSCIQISENDQCMSGDIFPTKELCINPNLRV